MDSWSPGQHPEPPDVPGYAVGPPLGAGASGAVWTGIRGRDGCDVALKVVTGDREQVSREVDAVRALRIDHVVPVRDVVALPDGAVAIVTDLMAGGSLRSIVAARGHLSPGEVVTVLVPIASALGDLHSHGVVHGDVSPDNILFDLRGRPALGDLGASHAIGQAPADVWGTDGFVAPEVLLGAPPGAASDVFALASVALFALTGQVPEAALIRAPVTLWLEAAGHPEVAGHRLAAVLTEALAAEAVRRPDAVRLASESYDAVDPEPLVLARDGDVGAGLTRRLRGVASGPGARPRELDGPGEARGAGGRHARGRGPSAGAARAPRRRAGFATSGRTLRGSARGLALLAVVSALLAGGAAAAVTRLTGGPPVAAGVGTVADGVTDPVPPSSRPPDPLLVRHPDARAVARIVQALADARAAAWTSPPSSVEQRRHALDAWSAPDGPARRVDEADLDALAAAHTRREGLHLTAVDVETQAMEEHRLVLHGRVDVSAHVVVEDAGRVTRPGEMGDPITLVLSWTDAGWRLWDVQAG